MTTGLAGCGTMGLPMALAMRRGGISVCGFDIRRDGDFGDLAVEFDPAAFGADLTTLFTVVRNEAETHALLFDAQGVLNHAGRLDTLVICSTLRPGAMHDIRARLPERVRLLDAPLSGDAAAAWDQRLTFMVGGDERHLDEVMIHLGFMGSDIHHIGPLGAGMTAKAMNNLVAAASTVATRTALDWGRAAGLDQGRLLQALSDNSGQTWFGSNFDALPHARDGFEANNAIGEMVADLGHAASAAPKDAPTDLPDTLIRLMRAMKPL